MPAAQSSPGRARRPHQGALAFGGVEAVPLPCGRRTRTPRVANVPGTGIDAGLLLAAYVPPTLVLDADNQIIAAAGGDVAPYLRRQRWRGGERVELLLRPELLPPVLRLRTQVGATASVSTGASLLDGTPIRITLRMQEGRQFVSFEAPHAGAQVGQLVPTQLPLDLHGQRELEEARKTIAYVIEELDHSQEEFDAIGRAMHASNEQLARANAALEAINEELRATNQRLTRSTAEVQAVNSELKSFLEHQGFSTFLLDRSLRLKRFNPVAATLFGLEPGDIDRPFAPRREPIADLVPGIRAGMRAHEPSTFRVVAEGRHLLVQISPVTNARRACAGTIVSCIDETEVRLAEQTLEKQLRQAQKMQAVGQLTGGIAHDFNNILASIMGYADLLARALGQASAAANSSAQPPPASMRYLGEILRASDRARSLIQQLLLYSHGGGGRPEPVDVRAFVDDSLSMLRSVFPATIALHTRFHDGLPKVHIDPVQASQVVMNLAINARDAMQGRGNITLTAETVRAEDHRCASCHESFSGTFVRLSVHDDGPGLPEDCAEQIFEPFFTTKEVGKGTGLGLSVVHGIVHEHGGHIEVRSSHAGAVFELLLPTLEATPAHDASSADPYGHAQLEAARAELQAEATSILVIDDEVPLAQMLRELLTYHGYDVTTCNSPAAALELLRERRFACVLCDLTMPGMTGVDLAAELLQRQPQLPICLYTGNRLLVDGDALATLPNVRALLDKPVDTHTLLLTLRAMRD